MARIKNITAEEALSNPDFMQDLQENYICIDDAVVLFQITAKTLYNIKCRLKHLVVMKYRNKLYFKREQLDLLFTPKKHNL